MSVSESTIWLTSRIRMRAEFRLRRMSNWLTALTVWYSTVLVCLTFIQIAFDANKNRDVISAIIAVSVFSLSLYIPSLSLLYRAGKYRECYLKLQRLIDSGLDVREINDKYYDILDGYENHSSKDRRDFIVKSYFDKQKVNDNAGELLPSKAMIFGSFVDYLKFHVIFALAFLAPLLLYKVI